MISPNPGAIKSHLIRTKDISNSQKFQRVWSFSVRNQSQRTNLKTEGAPVTLITLEFPRVLGVPYQDLGAEINIFSFLLFHRIHTHTHTHKHPLCFVSLLLLLLSCFSRVRLCATPGTAAHQAPPSLGFSRQEHWSGLPFPSPMHESEKWKWSCSVVSDS